MKKNVIPYVMFDEDTPFSPQERARERIGGGLGGLPAVPTKIEEVPFRYHLVVEYFCCRALDAFMCLTYHGFF